MNLLFTGKGTSGSWACRGEQLGGALGAVVAPMATDAQINAADLIVVVKRCPSELMERIKRSGKPWVWDVVDFYPQPEAASWSRVEAITWVRQKIRTLQPNAIIWPNARMEQDIQFDLPGLVLYHHHRPGIQANPIRERITRIGYEGQPNYLEGWEHAIHRECKARDWQFVVNPRSLSDVDVVLALRGGRFEGYAPTNWKSNVKLANAHASGTPFVGQPEYGYVETKTGMESWVMLPVDLGPAFDQLASQARRYAISRCFLKTAYPLDKAAALLREFLSGL